MFKFEIKKYIFNKTVVFMILGFVLLKCLISYLSIKIEVPYGINVYKDYLDRWDGVFTDSKAGEIEAENERLSTIQVRYDEMKEKYFSGLIDLDEFGDYTREYNLSKSQIDAFKPVYEKYLYYKESNEPLEFYYDLEHIELLDVLKKDFALALLLSFIINIIYDIENRSDISLIIRSLPKGKHEFQRTKIIAALCFAVVTALIFSGIDIILYEYKFSLVNLERPIHSIIAYSGFPASTSIIGGIFILIAVRVIYAIMVTAVSILMSHLTKRMFLSVFITSLISMLPIIL